MLLNALEAFGSLVPQAPLVIFGIFFVAGILGCGSLSFGFFVATPKKIQFAGSFGLVSNIIIMVVVVVVVVVVGNVSFVVVGAFCVCIIISCGVVVAFGDGIEVGCTRLLVIIIVGFGVIRGAP
jgi:hypothetical protein